MESTQPNTPEPSFFQRNGTTLKGVLIFFLMLVLLIPTSMVESLIYEREGRQREAINEVSSKWGQSQTISGPILVLPYEQTQRSTDNKEVFKETKFAYLLPDELQVNGQVTPEKRHRGIFDVVLYGSHLTLEGNFNQPDVQKLIPAGAAILWDKASLMLGIPDLRGLEDQVTLQWDGQNFMFDPGIPVSDLLQSGIHVPIALEIGGNESASKTHLFKIELSLKGSGTLFFTPVGKVTDVKITSPWADPSFTGAFLPDEKTVSPTGFEASWKVLNLNRNYPQQWTSDVQINFKESTFGVDFLMPVDNYQKSTRSVKYAILFIGLTFLTIFFIEMGQSRRVHPFQYALIGLALVIFYTLLVSISEHLTFNWAYLIAAIMTIGMTGLYARSLFQSNRMALFVSGTLTVLYGFLFVVLQQQDYALLIGSLGLFAILGVVMYVSRRVNWQG
ncbi:MAG: cell envelope integrity protein CreD [Phycisphaerae bacterium]|nr:cell envelope integrity protein CreD [Saprospiraceae bacterium]